MNTNQLTLQDIKNAKKQIDKYWQERQPQQVYGYWYNETIHRVVQQMAELEHYNYIINNKNELIFTKDGQLSTLTLRKPKPKEWRQIIIK